jgi:CheY-like chemotaxis protein
MGPTRTAVCLLVVEDEALVRLVLETELEACGFVVLPTDSAGAALEVIENSPDGFQALVTDVQLGESLSGFDVARRCRQIRPGLPVIFLADGPEPALDAEAEPGAVMLGRPFQPDRLTGLLTQLLKAPARA